MFSKEQIWNGIANDLRIIKHLATKVPKGSENYKPTEKQRTTLELLQYLAYSGAASLKVILENNPSLYKEYSEKAKNEVTLENFAEMIDKQEIEMKETFFKFDDEELKKEIDLWGAGMETKGNLLLDMIVKMLPSYKMQLFLYVKASGNEAINTSNLWRGVDGAM